MGLPYGENVISLTSTIFDWSTSVSDARTDGKTDVQWHIAVAAQGIFNVMRYINPRFTYLQLLLAKVVVDCRTPPPQCALESACHQSKNNGVGGAVPLGTFNKIIVLITTVRSQPAEL